MTSPGLRALTLADLQATIQPRLGQVETEMRRMIEADFPLISDVNRHLMRMRGKMFRPTLVLLADEATGETVTAREATLAAVIELIHLATLVHDDAVDHSVLRRGMPTIQRALLASGLRDRHGRLSSTLVRSSKLVRFGDLGALGILARVTNEMMTIGEMRQLLAHDPLGFSVEQYDLLIKAKTASLISGACEVGALSAPAAERRALAQFGEKLGMAFQIVDDLLDYTSDETVTGKPSGLDLREHKGHAAADLRTAAIFQERAAGA